MRNLAGVKEADNFIQGELYLAGIPLVRGEQSEGEVPYSIEGKLGNWTFSRAWYYWIASASEGNGLSLEIAIQLDEKEYPIIGGNQPNKHGQVYGHVIRVAGFSGGTDPREWAKHYDADGRKLVLDPKGEEETEFKRLMAALPGFGDNYDKLHFVVSLEGKIHKSVVDYYHIDNQLGLNELARIIRG